MREQSILSIETISMGEMTNPIKTCLGCDDREVRKTLTVEQMCTPCRKKERNRVWREANPGAMAENAKRWRDAGNKSMRPNNYAERERERRRRRYAEDETYREKAKEAAKLQRAGKTREQLNAELRAWHDANPGKQAEYHHRMKERMAPEERQERGRRHRTIYRAQRQANQARYNARRYGGEDIVTNEHLVALHKWQDHCCFWCREGLHGKETIEHVVPLSRDGGNTHRNVVLACAACNASKSDRIFGVEWKPTYVADVPIVHSKHWTVALDKRLTTEGIDCHVAEDHVSICDRRVYVLSSFWLGWNGDIAIRALKERQPTALLFFDKEFVRRSDAIINVIKAKAGLASRRGARNLTLDVPDQSTARSFIDRWHAMGFAGGTHYLGLRDDSEWWIVAAFREDVDRYEIVRMACRESVAGGVSRIMARFRSEMPRPWPIVAFTDQRMGDGASHFHSGFKADGATERSFFYATPETNGFYPRRDFQKQALEMKADWFDPSRTQVEIAKANGLMRVEGLPRLRFSWSP